MCCTKQSVVAYSWDYDLCAHVSMAATKECAEQRRSDMSHVYLNRITSSKIQHVDCKEIGVQINVRFEGF